MAIEANSMFIVGRKGVWKRIFSVAETETGSAPPKSRKEQTVPNLYNEDERCQQVVPRAQKMTMPYLDSSAAAPCRNER